MPYKIMGKNERLTIRSQFHCCCSPGDTWNPGASIHVIDLFSRNTSASVAEGPKREIFIAILDVCHCFKCTFQLYSSAFSISWYRYRNHVTLRIGEQYPITVYKAVFGVCVVLELSVIRCFCYYFLERIIFHHGFHHDSCDYHWDF